METTQFTEFCKVHAATERWRKLLILHFEIRRRAIVVNKSMRLIYSWPSQGRDARSLKETITLFSQHTYIFTQVGLQTWIQKHWVLISIQPPTILSKSHIHSEPQFLHLQRRSMGHKILRVPFTVDIPGFSNVIKCSWEYQILKSYPVPYSPKGACLIISCLHKGSQSISRKLQYRSLNAGMNW